MSGQFYRVTRDLHLYLGLFISPFILVFSVTVFFLVHAWMPRIGKESSQTRVIPNLALPTDVEKLSGRPQVDAVKLALENVGVKGEIGFIRHVAASYTLVIPVSIPGRETMVTVNLTNHTAIALTRETGLADGLVTLHKSPGQHGPTIRMNWVFMAIWRWFADATVYLTLFISVSGVYLWYALKAERKIGFLLLAAGTFTFFGLVYAICR